MKNEAMRDNYVFVNWVLTTEYCTSCMIDNQVHKNTVHWTDSTSVTQSLISSDKK